MNKSLKILLLATAVLQSAVVFGSGSGDDQESSPNRSNTHLVTTDAEGHALVRISQSPARSGGGLSTLPAINGFSLGSGMVAFDRNALIARARSVASKRVELADNIVAVNMGNARLSQVYQLPQKAVELFARYEDVMDRVHTATIDAQEAVDDVNEQLQPGAGKLVLAMNLMKLDIRHAEERAATLEALKANIQANKAKLLDEVDGAADAVEMLVGKISNDAQGGIPESRHSASVAGSQDDAEYHESDGEGGAESF